MTEQRSSYAKDILWLFNYASRISISYSEDPLYSKMGVEVQSEEVIDIQQLLNEAKFNMEYVTTDSYIYKLSEAKEKTDPIFVFAALNSLLYVKNKMNDIHEYNSLVYILNSGIDPKGDHISKSGIGMFSTPLMILIKYALNEENNKNDEWIKAYLDTFRNAGCYDSFHNLFFEFFKWAWKKKEVLVFVQEGFEKSLKIVSELDGVNNFISFLNNCIKDDFNFEILKTFVCIKKYFNTNKKRFDIQNARKIDDVCKIIFKKIINSFFEKINYKCDDFSEQFKQKDNKIHEFNAKIDIDIVNYNNNVNYLEKGSFNDALNFLPAELYVEWKEVFKLIPDTQQQFIDEFKEEFINKMDKTDVSQFIDMFLDEFKEKSAQKTENNPETIITPFILSLTYMLTEIKEFQNKFLSNFINTIKETVFNPNYTIYGPMSLNNNINMLRSAIISITKDNRLLEMIKFNTFLFIETLNRIQLIHGSFYFYSIEINAVEFFNTVFKYAKYLRNNKGPLESQNGLITFILNFLRDEKTATICLNNDIYIKGILSLIPENGLTKLVFDFIIKAFAITRDNREEIDSNKFFCFLQSYVDDNIKKDTIVFLTKLLYEHPQYVKDFDNFFYEMNFNFEENREYVLQLLLLISQENNLLIQRYIGKISDYKLDLSFLKGLLAGSTCIQDSSLFLIKNYSVLPLFFVNFGETETITDILEMFYNLANLSFHNIEMLHRGNVDLFLLKHFKGEMIDYNDNYLNKSIKLKIPSKCEKNIVFPLLKLILSTISSQSIVNEFISILESKKDVEIASLLQNILFSLDRNPIQKMPFGMIDNYNIIDKFETEIFKNSFSISFWAQIDLQLIYSVTSKINLFSFVDESSKPILSLYLQRNSMFLSFCKNGCITSVVVCNRLNSQLTHYLINVQKIKKNNEEKSIIHFYKNTEKLQDSEFCKIEFGKKKISMMGGSFEQEMYKKQSKNMGFISDLFIFNRIIKLDEIHLLSSTKKSKKDNVFNSSTDFIPKCDISSKFQQNQKENNNEIYNTTFINFFTDEHIQKLINLMNSSINLSPILCNILSLLIRKKKDISVICTNIYELLNKNLQQLTYNFYRLLTKLIISIENEKPRKCGLYDIIANYTIWTKTCFFKDVFHDWVANYFILFKNIFDSEFVCNFSNYFISENFDQNIVDDFIILISRILISFKIKNPQKKYDMKKLSNIFSNKNNEMKNIYYRIIYNIAPYYQNDIKNFGNRDIIIDILESISESEFALLSFYNLYKNSFHINSFQILKYENNNYSYIKSIENLNIYIENNICKHPDLFSLLCIISTLTQTSINNNNIPKRLYSYDCWYIAPLLALPINNTEEMIDFISETFLNWTLGKDKRPIIHFFGVYMYLIKYKKYQISILHKLIKSILSKLMGKLNQYNNKSKPPSLCDKIRYSLFSFIFIGNFEEPAYQSRLDWNEFDPSARIQISTNDEQEADKFQNINELNDFFKECSSKKFEFYTYLSHKNASEIESLKEELNFFKVLKEKTSPLIDSPPKKGINILNLVNEKPLKITDEYKTVSWMYEQATCASESKDNIISHMQKFFQELSQIFPVSSK